MENQTSSNQDCGCSDGCCTTKKKYTLWSKLIFIVIILAAGSIITIKLVGKRENSQAKTNDTITTYNAGISDTVTNKSCSKTCSPSSSSSSSSCCPKSKNN